MDREDELKGIIDFQIEEIKNLKTKVENKDSYIKRLERRIMNWETKYDKLLIATQRLLKGQ